jgi:hypothetical protein
MILLFKKKSWQILLFNISIFNNEMQLFSILLFFLNTNSPYKRLLNMLNNYRKNLRGCKEKKIFVR